MSKSTDNLQAAFAGESQANRKYLAFAKKAALEGFPNIARLFRAAAEAETVHAHAHLRALGGVKDTAGNIREAIAGEHHEFVSMYPEFLAAATEESHKPAEVSFKFALAVEEIHHGMYEEALKAVEAGQDLPERKLFVCPVCGNTVHDAAPDKCPVCNAPGSSFSAVE